MNKYTPITNIKDHVYYLRDRSITSIHNGKNKLFGIQFKINLPILFKNANSADYTHVYPLTDFFEKDLLRSIFNCLDFSERIKIVESNILNKLFTKHEIKSSVINSVISGFTNNVEECFSIKKLSDEACCSIKTAERYFYECIGISPKKAISVLRFRNALNIYVNDRDKFKSHLLGYYDNSHFYKEVKYFTAL